MSHAASMNLLSFDALRDPGSVDRRLKWALAGSVAVHVAFAAIASIRLTPMIERPAAPYHVDLVTLADLQVSPTPAPKSQPRPAPTAKPRKPERITDSLKGALESVAVPGPRNVNVATNVEPVSTPPPASQPDPPNPDVPRVQATPQPPQRASAPSTVPPTSSSDPQNVSLAQTLKRAVAKVKVPELPSSPPPSAELPPQKDEAPVRGPEKPPSRSGSLSKDTAEDQEDVPVAVPPPAPTLAKVQAPRPAVRKPVKPDPSRLRAGGEEGEDAIDALPIPPVEPLRAHRLRSRETERATHETLTDLHVGGAASATNKYWAQVWSRIDRAWVAPHVAIDQREPLQVVLAIRVRRSGRIQEEVLHFVRKSGNEYYDSAAKRAVVAASPLPSFPPDMTDPYYDFKFRFTFKHDQ